MTQGKALEAMSRAIHLGEWCPERERCSGQSAHSDAAARAAWDALEAAGLLVPETVEAHAARIIS